MFNQSSPPARPIRPNSSVSGAAPARRILIIDDNAAVHTDFRKVLGYEAATAASAMRPTFDIDSAYQGRDGVAMAQQALIEGRPYAMAFIDMRMPPGWHGLKTIEQLWSTDPDVQVVMCGARTDYDWTEVVQKLGHTDKLLVLRKPAEPIEVLQCATAMCRKWQNDRLVREVRFHPVQVSCCPDTSLDPELRLVAVSAERPANTRPSTDRDSVLGNSGGRTRS